MIKSVLVISLLVIISGCTSRTSLGECTGIQGPKNPKLIYEYSYWNILMGFIFSETIIVPVVIVFDALKCPVAVKSEIKG